MNMRQRIRGRIVDDWRAIGKRWSVWLTSAAITGQATWALVPSEARELLPQPQIIGLVLGGAALVAMFFKQGKNDGE
jgi:hypothetical protein